MLPLNLVGTFVIFPTPFQKAIRPDGQQNHTGGFTKRLLALFLFVCGLGGLGGLRLGHALLEFVDAACRINEFLLACVEGMAGVANTHNNHRFG
jgi:hypothetical protein